MHLHSLCMNSARIAFINTVHRKNAAADSAVGSFTTVRLINNRNRPLAASSACKSQFSAIFATCRLLRTSPTAPSSSMGNDTKGRRQLNEWMYIPTASEPQAAVYSTLLIPPTTVKVVRPLSFVYLFVCQFMFRTYLDHIFRVEREYGPMTKQLDFNHLYRLGRGTELTNFGIITHYGRGGLWGRLPRWGARLQRYHRLDCSMYVL